MLTIHDTVTQFDNLVVLSISIASRITDISQNRGPHDSLQGIFQVYFGTVNNPSAIGRTPRHNNFINDKLYEAIQNLGVSYL